MKRKTDNFNKFYNKKNNAAIKEAFRQEKKAAKKERKEAIERHFEEKRQAREAQYAAGKEKASIATHKGGPSAAPAAPTPKGAAPNDPNLIPLNKYIAHGGICSRRDAAELIRQGKVEVNDQLVTEPGTKVSPSDFVKVNGKKITISRNFVYILLNKPKDYITTTDDPQGRKTVLDLIRQATTERVYPVGRLDRNTSGVLLLTNDGDLSQKLAHPRHEIKKIYHVTLDKPLTKADFDKIAAGIQLEDGLAHVDVLAYADVKDKAQIGLEIHSGRNRIVRRIFEHLGYDVRGLDRVMYAGLTKKNVQRGHWRLLTEKEIRILKYLNASFRGSLSGPKSSAAANVVQDEEMEESAPKTADTKKSKVPFDRKFDAPAAKETGAKRSATFDKFADDDMAGGDVEASNEPGAKKAYGAASSGYKGADAGGSSKPRGRKSFSDKGAGPRKPGQRKPFAEKTDRPSKPGYRKSFTDKSEDAQRPGNRKTFTEKSEDAQKPGFRKSFSDKGDGPRKPGYRKPFADKTDGPSKPGYRKPFSDKGAGPARPKSAGRKYPADGAGKSSGFSKSRGASHDADPDNGFRPKSSSGPKRAGAQKNSAGSKRASSGKGSFSDKRSSDGKSSFDDKRSSGGKGSFGDKRTSGGKGSFGDKRSSDGKSSFGDKRASGGKGSFGDKRSSDGKSSFGAKRPSSSKNASGPKKPYRPR